MSDNMLGGHKEPLYVVACRDCAFSIRHRGHLPRLWFHSPEGRNKWASEHTATTGHDRFLWECKPLSSPEALVGPSIPRPYPGHSPNCRCNLFRLSWEKALDCVWDHALPPGPDRCGFEHVTRINPANGRHRAERYCRRRVDPPGPCPFHDPAKRLERRKAAQDKAWKRGLQKLARQRRAQWRLDDLTLARKIAAGGPLDLWLAVADALTEQAS